MAQYLMSVWHDDNYDLDVSTEEARRVGAHPARAPGRGERQTWSARCRRAYRPVRLGRRW
jgi:hypothetical protein